MRKLQIHYTCQNCQSGNEVHVPQSFQPAEVFQDKCHVCGHVQSLKFANENSNDTLHQCVVCERKDFYKQKDFNRKIGVLLFVIAAILSIWTYGISLIVLYLFDLMLFSRLGNIVICYKCQTIYRHVANVVDFGAFDHEMNDRIIYSDHDFQGKPLSH
jgi:hypothetical protein